jgi:tRNA (5-methylaminomethyl-2-thiouridylate)-methyltransferase
MNEEIERKMLVAMSGGVDSSVAALMVIKKGYQPIGVTMKLYDNDQAGMSDTKTCCSVRDVDDARAVAVRLDMPYYVVNYMDGFKEKVIDKFVRTYIDGATPNPCIDCNRYMKFGGLMEKAAEFGCEKVVTGHYARVVYDENRGEYCLMKAVDTTKDQTYVLYFLNQEQLAHLYLPLGEMTKNEARKLAEEEGFINYSKPDSQDICFVPDGNYSRVIEETLDRHIGEGDFVDREGRVLGKNKGYYHYTIGQRRGLGISAAEPLYVTEIIPETNTVVLGSNEELFTNEVRAVEWNYINAADASVEEMKVTAKIRYRAKETSGVLIKEKEGVVRVVFDDPVRAVTRGQSLVAYDGDRVVGGGIIV